MADVEQDAPLASRQHRWSNLPVLVENEIVAAVEVRMNVAGTHVFQNQIRIRALRVRWEVHHDRLGGELAGFDRAVDGVPRGSLEVGCLDTDDQVRIFFHHGGAGGGVHLGDIVFHARPVHPGAHDIQPGQDARLCVIDRAGFEGFEVAVSGAPGVHGRGDSVWQRVVIGLEIQIGAAGVEVGVDVDEARRDVIIAHVEDQLGVGGR